MRNVCLFLWHKNLFFRIQRTLRKHFLHPVGCRTILPAKSCQDAWTRGSQLVRGQVNMEDEAKLWSPIRSVFEVMVVWPVVRHCHGEELALSIDNWRLEMLQFLVYLIDLLSILLRCNGFLGIQKAVVDHTESRPPNSDHDLFWCKFGFGKYFGASSRSNHCTGHC